MRVQIDFPGKPIVKLTDFILSYEDLTLLARLQHSKPNLPVRYVGEHGQDVFIPILKLVLEDLQFIRSINP